MNSEYADLAVFVVFAFSNDAEFFYAHVCHGAACGADVTAFFRVRKYYADIV
jgi:hypothetical protein